MMKSLNQLEGGAGQSAASSTPTANRYDSPLNHVAGASTSKESEEERMIRLGEMTPFGTVMSNQGKYSL